ncbi:hypothetical protein BKH41_08170 [Helicobacter sp. 12S02232-10]|uniref:hypothetical protein n=1 Tax=Helicobacter sp. 12S02232-10 TaxID=1476197 RepID=UPI000BA64674|nr:hypothetical protein [Helicobacter sp. 12S02232-10]PAF47246.1 hypothetical protein BKH41_08170 [Helicobacter sp. 12S02232-10]
MEDNKKLIEFLKNLSKKEFDSKEYFYEAVDTIKNIYASDKFRHSYSAITAYILKDTTDEERNETLAKISENLSIIADQLKQSKDSKFCWNQFYKLQDHINLEVYRLEYYEEKILNLKKSLSEEEENLKTLQTQYRIVENNLKNQQDQYKTIENNLKNQQTQYVAILGIFASIILAFVGSFTFSTSVLTNIDKASIYKLVFVMILIGFFVINILYYLFKFVEKISLNGRESNKCCKSKIFWVNILIFILLLSDVLFYYLLSSFPIF